MSRKRIALLGNPNSGKTSLFNQLTGLNQKVGNFPGVTVDKKTGYFSVKDQDFELIDLPGTYSLYPKSLDEQVVTNVLFDLAGTNHPDYIIVVVDTNNLKRNLLLYTQVADLGIPTILALNMSDELKKNNIELNIDRLKEELTMPVVQISARQNTGINGLKEALLALSPNTTSGPFIELDQTWQPAIDKVKAITGEEQDYIALHILHQYQSLQFLPEIQKQEIRQIREDIEFDSNLVQVDETLKRYEKINNILVRCFKKGVSKKSEEFSSKLDKILTHRYFGLPVFFLVLFLIFQGIFTWATYPMDMIDQGVNWVNLALKFYLPAAWYTDLLTDGIIAGVGGVIIFIPQIAILFAFIAIMEESGYMARVTYMMDRLSRVFGLSGRSVVPMISSVACAVPAIMSARGIDNWKDRMITIFISPFISCSARIPVYTLLIAICIPEKYLFGVLNLQGLVMFGMYFLGLFAALGTALVLKWIIQAKGRSFFVMELPVYRMPRWKNVGVNIVQKVSIFVMNAGKVIVVISLILWFLASFGQGQSYYNAKSEIEEAFDKGYLTRTEKDYLIEAKKLETSYAGKVGKVIEPVIEPLGFDWKVGIALITSFAAREVFVGTMATIYSVGPEADHKTLKERLTQIKDPETGQRFFTIPVAVSLMIFYVFAMQCMSTLAVVRRETKSWKWPLVQTVYMTGLAYICSWIAYTVLS